MRKKKLNISKSELQQRLTMAEKNNDFANRTELFAFLASDLEVSTTTIINRLKENNLYEAIQTPLGKRGFDAPPKVNRTSRGDKFKTSEGKKHISEVKLVTPPSHTNTVNKLAKGSLTAAIKLKCLDCTNYNIKEIRECPIKACSLYMIRPYS